jgi:hypothetical protein
MFDKHALRHAAVLLFSHAHPLAVLTSGAHKLLAPALICKHYRSMVRGRRNCSSGTVADAAPSIHTHGHSTKMQCQRHDIRGCNVTAQQLWFQGA